MGVHHVEHRPGHAPIWTEERIHWDLEQYLAGRDQWPSREEFEHDGRTALRNAVNRTEGADRWARELGLPRRIRLSGVRRGRTPEVIERELKALIGGRAIRLSLQEFRAAGLYSVANRARVHRRRATAAIRAATRNGGIGYWAQRLGLPRGRLRPE